MGRETRDWVLEGRERGCMGGSGCRFGGRESERRAKKGFEQFEWLIVQHSA